MNDIIKELDNSRSRGRGSRMTARTAFFPILFIPLLVFAGCAAPAFVKGDLDADSGSTGATGMPAGSAPPDSREMIVHEPYSRGPCTSLKREWSTTCAWRSCTACTPWFDPGQKKDRQYADLFWCR